MKQNTHLPILIVGVPRSGTTWTANVLAQAPNSWMLHEPDNEKINFLSFLWKRNYHRMPYIREDSDEPVLRAFWDHIFNRSFLLSNTVLNHSLLHLTGLSKKRLEERIVSKCSTVVKDNGASNVYSSTEILTTSLSRLSLAHYHSKHRIRIIKSVHSGLVIPFISSHFKPRIVVLFRHPAAVVASCLRMQLADGNRRVFKQTKLAEDYLQPYLADIKVLDDPLAAMGLQVAIFHHIWEKQLLENPDWISISHEALCHDPERKFRQLYNSLDLEWTSQVSNYLRQHDVEGTDFDIQRRTSTEIDKWTREMTTEQIKSIRKGYELVPCSYYEDFNNTNAHIP
jgi:hypothetical protein